MAEQTKHPTRRSPVDLSPRTSAPPEVIPRQEGLPADVLKDAPMALLGEFESMFEYAPVAMILVNRRRQVLRVNRAARRFSRPDRPDWRDMPPGVFICCPNSGSAEGCGHGPHCSGCTLRRLIDRSFETRRETSPVEALAPYAVGDRVEERWLRISTSHLVVEEGERTLLCIEDITERRLPPGAPGGELG